MQIKSIIIDDEEKAILSLKWELENYCSNVENQACFTNPEEALIYLNTHHIDLVFLDIEMPKMDGLQFLNYFKERDFLVVFTTAYDHYAIEAIKNQAFDYLLKPVDSDDLIKTVQNAAIHIAKSNQNASKIGVLNMKDVPEKIKLSVDGQLIFLENDEIVYCKSDGNYCDIFLEDSKRLTLTKKLKEMDAILPSSIYLRVHNSYIVNMEKVRSFDRKESCIYMKDGLIVPVSRQRKLVFLEKMG